MVTTPYAVGTCSCGAVSLAVDVKPLMSYNCHCSNCRAYVSKYRENPVPCHAAGAFFKWNVSLKQDSEQHMEYEHTSALFGLFAMSRGRCKHCKQPIWESGERLVVPFAMVSGTPLLKNIEPTTNLFYNSGPQQGPTEGLKTLYTDLGSLLYELYYIASRAIPLLPWSIYKRMARDKQNRSLKTD